MEILQSALGHLDPIGGATSKYVLVPSSIDSFIDYIPNIVVFGQHVSTQCGSSTRSLTPGMTNT